MRDIPIIFSAPMILALLDGRKTMTRRLAWRAAATKTGITRSIPSPWQNIKVGDRLYVRESLHADRMVNFLTGERSTNAFVAYYNADNAEAVSHDGFNLAWTWARRSLPSIHMPRLFSRLTLIVTEAKIERLQDISDEDAISEGWPYSIAMLSPLNHPSKNSPRFWFAGLWTNLHGHESWESNPEVVAMSFETIHQNIDRIAA